MYITTEQARLLKELAEGKQIPSSQLRAEIFRKLREEKLLLAKRVHHGKVIYTDNPIDLLNYLNNHYLRCTLDEYIVKSQASPTRTDNVYLTGNSKNKDTERVFQGFLFKVTEPIQARWKGKEHILTPANGLPVFMPYPDSFKLPEDITIVLVENSENFCMIENQIELFGEMKCFFVPYYPREHYKYFTEWLQKQPNNYVHYGDFDFAGIHIYQSQYKKYVTGKSEYLVPKTCFRLFKRFGKKELYDNQLNLLDRLDIDEPGIRKLIQTIQSEHKGLEQEVYNKDEYKTFLIKEPV